jgi:hypothetical protein
LQLQDTHAKVKKDYLKLVDELSQAKETITALKATKTPKVGKDLQAELTRLKRANSDLQLENTRLATEKKNILSGEGVISQSEFDSLVRQLEQETTTKTRYKQLFEVEQSKRNELKDRYSTLTTRIDELEKRMQEERPTSGRKRNSNIDDGEVIRMSREEGKSLRAIAKQTELSVNTIRGILKSVSK